MAELDLATISFNQTWPIVAQIRLLGKYLTDDYELSVYDNSDDGPAIVIQDVCSHFGVRYMRIPGGGFHKATAPNTHAQGLNYACHDLLRRGSPHIGFLDHDVFPTTNTSLVELTTAGFFGISQRHPKSGRRYLWPGFCCFSKEWLHGRVPNFGGIEGVDRSDAGDTGSMLADLFVDSDWEQLPPVKYGYIPIRPDDNQGTQSWCIEQIGDWLHLSNVSNWMAVPNPGERTELLRELVDKLWTQ